MAWHKVCLFVRRAARAARRSSKYADIYTYSIEGIEQE
jgi:hypothetical protein